MDMWCLFWNKYLLCIRPKRLTWYLEGKRCSNQPDDAFAAHTSTQLPQDGVHSECLPPPHPPPPLFHTGTSVVGSGWVGVGREWLAHTNLNSALLLSVCDHIQEERTTCLQIVFLVFLCSLVPGRKQVDVTSSQSVTITSRLIRKLGCCGCFKREWKQWGIFIFFLLVTFLFRRQETPYM